MARPATGHDENTVRAKIAGGRLRMRGDPVARRFCHPVAFPAAYRLHPVDECVARLDLDEHDQVAALRDEIDLAATNSKITVEDSEEFQPQRQFREPLGAESVIAGGLPVTEPPFNHSREPAICSARA